MNPPPLRGSLASLSAGYRQAVSWTIRNWPMTEVNIRKALMLEGMILTEIAHVAKRHWGYPEEWMKLWRGSLTLSAEYISRHEVFVCQFDEKIVGFYALIQSETFWELDHLWILPEFMSRGFGRRLFYHAVGQLNLLAPGAALQIESDPNAELFYLRMGAERVGEITTDWQGVKRTTPSLRFTPARAS
jgi:ribosomal protein S18 acetylase RimI-like enzyme